MKGSRQAGRREQGNSNPCVHLSLAPSLLRPCSLQHPRCASSEWSAVVCVVKSALPVEKPPALSFFRGLSFFFFIGLHGPSIHPLHPPLSPSLPSFVHPLSLSHTDTLHSTVPPSSFFSSPILPPLFSRPISFSFFFFLSSPSFPSPSSQHEQTRSSRNIHVHRHHPSDVVDLHQTKNKRGTCYLASSLLPSLSHSTSAVVLSHRLPVLCKRFEMPAWAQGHMGTAALSSFENKEKSAQLQFPSLVVVVS